MRYLIRKLIESSNMKEGNPYRLLLSFMIPLFIGNLFQQLYNIIDSIIVGQYVGKSALAAVGSSFHVSFLLISLFVGFGLGAMIVVAQLFGKKDYQSLQSLLNTAYKVILLASVPLAVIGIFFARPILVLLKLDYSEEALTQATLYLQIVSVGFIGQLGFNVNAGFLQGMGDSLSSLLFLVIATVINVVLDIVFTIIFPWGVVGVALATVIAQTFSWIFGIFYINRMYSYLHINLLHLSFDKKLLYESLRLGFPSSVQQVLYALGSMFLAGLINQQGEAFMAGYTAAYKLDTFVFLPILSMSMAVTTYIGQNIVDGITKRVKDGVVAGLVLTLILSIVLGTVVYVFRYPLMHIFSFDESVVNGGVIFLEETMLFYAPLAVLYVFNAVFQGSGNTYMPMFSSIFTQVILRIPSAMLLVSFNPKLLYYCFPITWIFGSILVTVYYISGLWKKHIRVVN